MKKLRFILLLAIALLTFSLYSCDDECAHNYETVTVDSTCTSDGKIASVCKSCGDTKESILPAKGHSFTFSVTQADCDSAGYTKYSCECGYSYKSDITSPKGHDYSAKVTAHTCTEAGYTTYKCKNCNDSYVADLIAPTGHNLSIVAVAPTCSDEGYTRFACTVCPYTYNSDYVKPLGHTVSKISVTLPTCTEGGSTLFGCSECDYKFESEFTEPLGHSITCVTVAPPTCTEVGYTQYACSECDFGFNGDFTEPLGHNHELTVTSVATCVLKGEEKYECACGDSYSIIAPPLGHVFEKTVTPPTVSDMGYTEYTCDCGFNYIGSYRFYEEIFDNAYANNDQVIAHGIDISKWNHTVNSQGEYEPIDWVALKEAGVDYVILKIGSTLRADGTLGGIEPTFEMDYEGAKAAGIDVGVYFFTYSTTVSGIRRDAEMLLTYLEGKQFEYPVYLDVEPAEDENYHPENIASPILTEMFLTFFSVLQREGYYTGLYVNNEFLFNVLQTDNMIELFEIWYARPPALEDYTWNPDDTESFVWNTEKYGKHLGMWQYCWTGQLAPIVGSVDFNYSYKDYPSIIKEYGFNGYGE